MRARARDRVRARVRVRVRVRFRARFSVRVRLGLGWEARHKVDVVTRDGLEVDAMRHGLAVQAVVVGKVHVHVAKGEDGHLGGVRVKVRSRGSGLGGVRLRARLQPPWSRAWPRADA